MARPRKPKSERFSSEIRVLVRPALKAMVQQAAANEYLDEAAFIRSLLERNVRTRIAVTA